MTTLCFLDTETTGLDEVMHEVWEVALIRRVDDCPDREFEWQLIPTHLETAEPKALELNGFHDRFDHRTAFSRAVFARQFAMLTSGATLVVNNPVFDVPRLQRLVQPYAPIGWHYHPIDVGSLIVGYLKGLAAAGATLVDPGDPPYSGRVLREQLAIKNEAEHTAMADTRWLVQAYDLVMGTKVRA